MNLHKYTQSIVKSEYFLFEHGRWIRLVSVSTCIFMIRVTMLTRMRNINKNQIL